MYGVGCCQLYLIWGIYRCTHLVSIFKPGLLVHIGLQGSFSYIMPISYSSDVFHSLLINSYLRQQNNQLDFLLNRAKEYSDFIANDIDELQSNMQAKAATEAAGGGSGSKKKGSKKRTPSKDDSSKKKKKRSKKNNGEPSEGEVNLQTAQDKYAGSSGKKPIFIQPKNLDNNCTLKDYQLEGTRWLVSLYENGVSGILADEMG